VEVLVNELPQGIWRDLHNYLLLDPDGRLREKLTATQRFP
jgi:hypothetical protein